MTLQQLIALLSLACDGEWRVLHADALLQIEDEAVLQELERLQLVQWFPADDSRLAGRPGVEVVRLTPIGRERVAKIQRTARGEPPETRHDKESKTWPSPAASSPSSPRSPCATQPPTSTRTKLRRVADIPLSVQLFGSHGPPPEPPEPRGGKEPKP